MVDIAGSASITSITSSTAGSITVGGAATDKLESVGNLPPLGTIDEIAHQMTHGFWGGDAHHFAVTQGGSITVNLLALTAEGRAVARQALQLWSDIIGVNFVELTGSAQITFDDLQVGTGAFSDSEWSNGTTDWATVNVSLQRLSLHTYLHEIGHALGLGHTAFANSGTAAAVYPDDALWRNDGSAISVMSYFDNGENSYYAGLGFTNNPVVTPQLADIVAVGNLYGLSTTTRTGDTTYGFNNTSGREIFSAAQYSNVAYTVFDSGGTDTLDYSGFGQNQLINLNPEAFSNIGPGVGNVSIARGVVIENAIGGSGNDTLIGNTADNLLSGRAGTNTLTGGAGADTFRDTAANLNGDTITDFSPGDRLVFSDADVSGFTFSLNGNLLTFTGGSLTLGSVPAGRMVARSAAEGGVELIAHQYRPVTDFNGDGRSDILWRDGSGALSQWLGQADGSYAWNPNAAYHLPNSWQVDAATDFNGDGRSDLLWRNEDGTLWQWLGQADGTYAYNADAAYQLPAGWQIAGTGDFNGDGRGDILWRNEAGALSEWLAQAGGSFAWNPNAAYVLGTDWQVAGLADFNGDGRDDILWRNDAGAMSQWLGQAGGTFVYNPNAAYELPTAWEAAASGDFNGDGRDDMLWRNAEGALSQWLGQADGTFAWNPSAAYQLPAEWDLASSADFNGDQRDDLLWRNQEGALSQWLGQADGTFAWNPAAAHQIASGWELQPDTLL